MRELIDGSAGFLDPGDLLPAADRRWREGHSDRVEEAARQAETTR